MKARKRHFLVYFILLLGIPGAILAYFAFRGIQNDQALVEKENRESLMAQGQNVIDSVRSHLDHALKPWQAGRAGDQQADTVEPGILLNTLILPDTGGNSWLLPTPDRDPAVSSTRLLPLSPMHFSDGWALEYQDKDYAGAISYYETQLKRTASRQESAAILNALSRLYRKDGQALKAIEINERINVGYGDQVLSGTIPLSWVSRASSFNLYLELGRHQDALKTITRISESLLGLQEAVSWDDYVYLVQQTNALMDSIPGIAKQSYPELAAQADSLASIMNAQLKTAHYLHTFRTLSPEIAQSGLPGRKHIEKGSQPFFYALVSGDQARYALLYDLQGIAGVVEKIMNRAGNASWKLTSRDGTLLRASLLQGEADWGHVSVPFPPDLPPWNLALAEEPVGLWDAYRRSGQGIFIYILLFIMVVLVTGIIFTVRTINSELRLSQMKSDFISTVSHEFKSPLTAIRQMTERLERNRVSSEERKMEYYRAMHAQTVRLSHLIENILDFSRLESGEKTMLLKPVNLNELVRESVSRFEERLIQQSFPVDTRLDRNLPEVPLDKAAMSQVIENLMDNALKYAYSDRGLVLETERKNGSVLLRVMDFGPGIEKEYLPRIFDRFYRGGAELTRSVKGSGIGLALVKKIVEGHRGHIDVETGTGAGTKFTIEIPIKNE